MVDTNLAETVQAVEGKERYDTSVKEMLADKQVLSRILKYTLEEFMQMEIPDIIECLDDPEIASVRTEPGFTNMLKVEKLSEEDSIPGEGKIFYDIRFRAYCPNGQLKILVNVEAQNESKPGRLGYRLDNRILYYLSRMISAQKGVEFTESNYDDIKPVRSIWICMDAAKNEDSINKIRFTEDVMFGESMELPDIDKMQGIIIRLRKNSNVEQSRNELINMLEILLRKEPAENKKKALEQYGFIMNNESERKVNEMCNLSEWMIAQGYEQGIEQGIARGIEQGIARTYFELVQSGELSAARAAEKMRITVEEFLEQMNEAGFTVFVK